MSSYQSLAERETWMHRQEARSTEPKGARGRRVMGTPLLHGEAEQETKR